MTITTLSSREFNQDAGRAKRAAKDGPVFLTDRVPVLDPWTAPSDGNV